MHEIFNHINTILSIIILFLTIYWIKTLKKMDALRDQQIEDLNREIRYLKLQEDCKKKL